jgi:hypothetical protein
MAAVNKSVGVIVAIMAGKTHEMDTAARLVKDAVVAEALQHRDTGAYIRNLSIHEVRGQSGSGRRVTDRLVVADDPGSAAIEYGHLTRVPGGRRVQWVAGHAPMRRGLARVAWINTSVGTETGRAQ